MSHNRSPTDLKLVSWLDEIGVYSEGELRHVGEVGAHQMIKEKYPEETLPVCYYLYSFEEVLVNKHWNEIGEQKKKHLKSQIG